MRSKFSHAHKKKKKNALKIVYCKNDDKRETVWHGYITRIL